MNISSKNTTGVFIYTLALLASTLVAQGTNAATCTYNQKEYTVEDFGRRCGGNFDKTSCESTVSPKPRHPPTVEAYLCDWESASNSCRISYKKIPCVPK